MKYKIPTLLIVIYTLISFCFFVAFFLCKGSFLLNKTISDYIYCLFQSESEKINDISIINKYLCFDDGDDVFFAKKCESIDKSGNKITIYVWSSINNNICSMDKLDTRMSNDSDAHLVLIDYYGDGFNLDRISENTYGINIQGKELVIDGTAIWSPAIPDEDGNFCSILMPYSLWKQYFDTIDVVCIKLNHLSTPNEKQVLFGELSNIGQICDVVISSSSSLNFVDTSLRGILYIVFITLIIMTYIISDIYQRQQRRKNKILYYLGLSKYQLLFFNWLRLEIIVLSSIVFSTILLYLFYLLCDTPIILNYGKIDFLSSFLILVITFSFVNFLFVNMSNKFMRRL